MILALAARVIWKWARGDYRGGRHRHGPEAHRHLHRPEPHRHRRARTPAQAFGIGVLHGLAGTGAVVVLLIWLSWNVNAVFFGGALATEVELALHRRRVPLASELGGLVG